MYAYPKLTVPNHCKSVVEVYKYAHAVAPGDWSGNGDFAAAGAWYYVGSAGNNDGDGSPATVDVIGPVVGNTALSVPDWCDDPITSGFERKGYESYGWSSQSDPHNPQAFVRWNVAGGFVYC